MVFRLTSNPDLLPPPSCAEPDGLIAVGGDLSPRRLVVAYLNGFFPWYGFHEEDEILWWCPQERFVIFPDEIHISHTMRQLLRRDTYTVTMNKAFDRVIKACSETDGRKAHEGAWLGDDMIKAYTTMHRMRMARSVEVWNKAGDLVGGLYGLKIGRCEMFFGESMFSREPNASKLALIRLAQEMQGGRGVIDCQFETPHLKSMGGRTIPYDEYMRIMRES